MKHPNISESELDTPIAVDTARQLGAAEPLARSVASIVAGRADPRTVLAMQRAAGNRATLRALSRVPARRQLARIGYPLFQPLPPGAPTPVEDHAPEQRRWSKEDYFAMWEAEQGRKLTEKEKKTIRRGCIGIVAENLEGSGDPALDEVYDSFDAAYRAVASYNSDLWHSVNPWASPYVLFGILFWSNQSDDRRRPDPGAFLADSKTHKIDMSNYKFRARMGTRSWVNFDFGFWDQTTGCFWHANHKDLNDDPMVVYQSTAQKFAKRFISAIDPGEVRYGYDDFDRVGYGVAQSNVYDPSKQKFLGTPVPTPAPAPPPNKPPPNYGPPPGS